MAIWFYIFCPYMIIYRYVPSNQFLAYSKSAKCCSGSAYYIDTKVAVTCQASLVRWCAVKYASHPSDFYTSLSKIGYPDVVGLRPILSAISTLLTIFLSIGTFFLSWTLKWTCQKQISIFGICSPINDNFEQLLISKEYITFFKWLWVYKAVILVERAMHILSRVVQFSG